MGLLAKVKTLICRSRLIILIEFCHHCGRRQPLVWWCDDYKLWQEVTGCQQNGIYCPRCFDRMAARKGILLKWYATRWGNREIVGEPPHGTAHNIGGKKGEA